MANEYAGRYYEALFASNSRLVKSAPYSVYVDQNCSTYATLYLDRTKATRANDVLFTDETGMAEFYASSGDYYLRTNADGLVRKVVVPEDQDDTVNRAEVLALIAASDDAGAVLSINEAGRVEFTVATHFALTNGHGVFYQNPADTPPDHAAYFDIVHRSLTSVGEL